MVLRTPHGDRFLTPRVDESIVDLCRRYGLPTTQMTSYLRDSSGELTLVVRPLAPLNSYRGDSQVVLFPNRNLDYHGLLGGDEIVRERAGASTWLRVREVGGGGEGRFVTEYLTPDHARELVASHVAEALRSAAITDEPLIVGVSGGGDSNALLGAIVNAGLVSRGNIHPVMMLGIPDWDKGAQRAEAICAEHQLVLHRVEERETARILGFADPCGDWVTAFERAFPDDDLEVLGVYGVRKVLQSVAIQCGARRIVIGTNLEDCLADALYYVSRGKVPFPKPVGPMGPVDVLCPLWMTPKALIDGCYPKYSRENYETRYPSRMLGRAYYYYLAQMLTDVYPGAAQELLRGTSQLSQRHFEELSYDREFQTSTMADIPFNARLKLRAMFGATNIV